LLIGPKRCGRATITGCKGPGPYRSRLSPATMLHKIAQWTGRGHRRAAAGAARAAVWGSRLQRVASVRISLLARTTVPDRGHTEQRTYRISNAPDHAPAAIPACPPTGSRARMPTSEQAHALAGPAAGRDPGRAAGGDGHRCHPGGWAMPPTRWDCTARASSPPAPTRNAATCSTSSGGPTRTARCGARRPRCGWPPRPGQTPARTPARRRSARPGRRSSGCRARRPAPARPSR
jgi:hypothetical protein